MANKMTKKEWFAILATVVEGSDMEDKEGALAFINHEVELLNKKSTKSGVTKAQKENISVMENIKAALKEIDEPVTITELQIQNAAMGEYSNQKLSALLKKLVESGEVVKTVSRKKSYFSLAE